MEEKYHSPLPVTVTQNIVKMMKIFRQLKKQAMFIFALRQPNNFLRSNNPVCSTKGKQTGLRNNNYSVQNGFCYYFMFEIFSPFCEIRHIIKLNKQNLQRQNLESIYTVRKTFSRQD